uniref:Uncharacterized protein n=1 Tax=Physcomitrium patens TaxID=3218 RepID=A0A2K1L222_PHYPA|nr:hypothetical protein PHYPA_002875 [Physcomitrium patens]
MTIGVTLKNNLTWNCVDEEVAARIPLCSVERCRRGCCYCSLACSPCALRYFRQVEFGSVTDREVSACQLNQRMLVCVYLRASNNSR